MIFYNSSSRNTIIIGQEDKTALSPGRFDRGSRVCIRAELSEILLSKGFDMVLWRDAKKRMRKELPKQDFIIKSKEHFRFTRDSMSGYGVKYILADTNSSRLITNWIFLKDNKLYRVMNMYDSLRHPGEFYKTVLSNHPTAQTRNDWEILFLKISSIFSFMIFIVKIQQ